MENNAAAEKVQFLEEKIEDLVKEAIVIGVPRGEIFEEISKCWKKEHQKFMPSRTLEKEKELNLRNYDQTTILYIEGFIKKAIQNKVCKSKVKSYISKLWDQVYIISNSITNKEKAFVGFSAFEKDCANLIIFAINHEMFRKKVYFMIDMLWDKVYRMEKLPSESEEEKQFKEKVRKYVSNDKEGFFWFVNSIEYKTAEKPPYATNRVSSYEFAKLILENDMVEFIPEGLYFQKGMYWKILEEKYEPIIPIETSVAEEVFWAIKYISSSNGVEDIKPAKIVNKAMKRMGKIYSRWDANIEEDIRRTLKLLRLYVHEILPCEECQIAIDSLSTNKSTYFDKAVIRVIWEIEHN